MPVDDAGPESPDVPLRAPAVRRTAALGVIATGTAASSPALHGLRTAAREYGYALTVFSVPGLGGAPPAAGGAGAAPPGGAGWGPAATRAVGWPPAGPPAPTAPAPPGPPA